MNVTWGKWKSCQWTSNLECNFMLCSCFSSFVIVVCIFSSLSIVFFCIFVLFFLSIVDWSEVYWNRWFLWSMLSDPQTFVTNREIVNPWKKDNFKKSEKNTNVPFFLVGLWIHERSFQKVWEKNVLFYFWWEEINARQEEEFVDVLRSKWDDKGTTHLF